MLGLRLIVMRGAMTRRLGVPRPAQTAGAAAAADLGISVSESDASFQNSPTHTNLIEFFEFIF